MKIRYLLASALCLIAVSSVAQNKRELRVRAKVGDSYSYTLKSVISAVGDQGQVDFGATFVEKLVSVGREMRWEVRFKVDRVKATGVMAGAEPGFRQMDNLVMQTIQNDLGEVLRLSIGGREVPSKGSSNVTLPRRPVAIGDSWTSQIEVGGQIVPIGYSLVGYVKSGQRLLAKIQGSFPKGSIARAVKPTNFWVDVANGKMVRGEALTDVTTDGKQVRLYYRIDMSLPTAKRREV